MHCPRINNRSFTSNLNLKILGRELNPGLRHCVVSNLPPMISGCFTCGYHTALNVASMEINSLSLSELFGLQVRVRTYTVFYPTANHFNDLLL